MGFINSPPTRYSFPFRYSDEGQNLGGLLWKCRYVSSLNKCGMTGEKGLEYYFGQQWAFANVALGHRLQPVQFRFDLLNLHIVMKFFAI